MRVAILISLLLIAGFVPVQSQRRPVALRFGAVVTGLGQTVNDRVIVVEGDRIKTVGSGNRVVPAGATTPNQPVES